MESFEEAFGHNLCVMRAKARMSRKELAAKSGVSDDSIGKYERGEMTPLTKTSYLLADALGCTVNDLCGWPAAK